MVSMVYSKGAPGMERANLPLMKDRSNVWETSGQGICPLPACVCVLVAFGGKCDMAGERQVTPLAYTPYLSLSLSLFSPTLCSLPTLSL